MKAVQRTARRLSGKKDDEKIEKKTKATMKKRSGSQNGREKEEV
jgi:hypothetical protein